MKKRVALLCAGIFLSITLLCAQDPPQGLVTAFKNGNAGALHGYLGDKVELIIQSQSLPMDQQKARNRLAEFFAANKVRGFQVNHQGKRDESGFIVGTLATSNGNFRVNCFFRKVGDKYVIHQIRIDKSNE